MEEYIYNTADVKRRENRMIQSYKNSFMPVGSKPSAEDIKKTALNSSKYFIRNKGCSWGMHLISGKYVYVGAMAQKIEPFMKACGMNCELEDKNTLIFWADRGNGCKQRMFFKFVRYAGNRNTRAIIDTTIKAWESGMNPYNALMLGHFYESDIPYYTPSMDIMGSLDGYVPVLLKGDDIESQMRERFRSTPSISRVFQKNKDIAKNKALIALMTKEKFKEAEKLLEQ